LAAERPFRIGLPRRSFLADSTHAEVRMPEDRENLAREAVRKVLRDAPWQFSKEGNRQFFRDRMEVEHIDMLVALARAGDKDAVEILRKCARDARSAGMKVPPDDLQEFVWEWFIDGPPKAKSGSSPKDTELRYTAIARLVQIVSEDYGFPEYSNSEHRGDPNAPMSSCRLVAEELRRSVRTVEEIWADRKASLTRRHRPPPK
jgi:hypothetical protein